MTELIVKHMKFENSYFKDFVYCEYQFNQNTPIILMNALGRFEVVNHGDIPEPVDQNIAAIEEEVEKYYDKYYKEAHLS